MTDANLMDANCIHGEVWYECKKCEADMNAFMEEAAVRDEALRSLAAEGYTDEDF
jgi:hypothetical protein